MCFITEIVIIQLVGAGSRVESATTGSGDDVNWKDDANVGDKFCGAIDVTSS